MLPSKRRSPLDWYDGGGTPRSAPREESTGEWGKCDHSHTPYPQGFRPYPQGYPQSVDNYRHTIVIDISAPLCIGRIPPGQGVKCQYRYSRVVTRSSLTSGGRGDPVDKSPI